jgi:hypothetical protein
MKVDARFCSPHDGAAVRGWLAAARCQLALCYGERSHVGAAELRGTFSTPGRAAAEASALRDVAAAGAAATVQLLPLRAGHYLLEDAPLALRDGLAACLAQWAATGALDATGPRLPEALGLRPLPQFDTLQDAARALRPRAVPTCADIQAALEQLAVDEDGPASEEDEDARRGTALAHQPRDYFGFVG